MATKTKETAMNKKVGSDLVNYHNGNATLLDSKTLAANAGYLNSKGEGNYQEYQSALFAAMGLATPRKTGRKPTLKPLNETINVKLQKNGNLALSRAFLATMGSVGDHVAVVCDGSKITITLSDYVGGEDDDDYEEDEEDVLSELEQVAA